MTALQVRPAASVAVVDVPPRALVRTSCLALPSPGPAGLRCAGAAEAALTRRVDREAATPAAEQALYRLAGGTTGSRRTQLLLPLRRAILRGEVGPALAAQAIDVAPEVSQWLALDRELVRAEAELAAATDAALAEARVALAGLCGEEALHRAAAFTSPTLLDAMRRAAGRGGDVDRRAAKSEATVLRHVLRAATKTVPLSWFAVASWAGVGDVEPTTGPDARALPDLAAVAAVVDAVVAALPADEQPLRVAGGTSRSGGRIVFPRAGGAETVSLPATRALLTLLDAIGERASLADLALRLGSTAEALRPTVSRLRSAGLLLPARICDEQAARPVAGVTAWLRSVGRHDAARDLDEIARTTEAWGQATGPQRTTLRSRLADLWVGLPGGAEARPPYLTEDVSRAGLIAPPAVPERERVAALHGLFEAFDWFTVVRAAQRARFVAMHGCGGVVGSVIEYAAEYDALWRDPALLTAPDLADDPVLCSVRSARARVATAVQETTDGDLVLTHDALRDAWPRQLDGRPVSYSVFTQQESGDSGPAVVNEVYGGWGRFASRFLSALPVGAGTAIRADLSRLPNPVQIRPVEHYAANRHPLLVEREIVDGPGPLSCGGLEICHDLTTDAVRVRVAATGELLDVVYLGILVPLALPRHLVPLVNDLGSGLVDLDGLRPARPVASPAGEIAFRPRLSAPGVVLARRSWSLDRSRAEQLAADVAAGGLAAAARWRATTGWPRAVFVGAGSDTGAAAAPRAGVGPFVARMGRARSQFVDLADPLHVRLLPKLIARLRSGLRVEEALPVLRAGEPASERVLETYRGGAR